jgi:hypothetical protein
MRRPPRLRVAAVPLLPAATRPVPAQLQGAGLLLLPERVGAVPLQVATRRRPVARVARGVPALPQVAEVLQPEQGAAVLPQVEASQPAAARVALAPQQVAELLLPEQAVAVPLQVAAWQPVAARAVRAPPEVQLPAQVAEALPPGAPLVRAEGVVATLLLAAAPPAQLARANRNSERRLRQLWSTLHACPLAMAAATASAVEGSCHGNPDHS